MQSSDEGNHNQFSDEEVTEVYFRGSNTTQAKRSTLIETEWQQENKGSTVSSASEYIDTLFSIVQRYANVSRQRSIGAIESAMLCTLCLGWGRPCLLEGVELP